ncbi:hypothetical protein D0Z07_7083 [Hyphodiscus hymeniophilus]|uniref:Uncharacterized protein n=1 Tax=Hyphodiscus hymeniophilus TaxID=353542 RepID=A0A9P6VFQ8_9HELO|nr:hypothetical protein D0Z07_7083 [Hyphodiscus hymeniophilus]
MSTDYPSSNPFRRKAPPSTASAPAEHPSILSHIAFQQTHSQPPSDSTNSLQIEIPKKVLKKVRVQSPPPLSPSIPDSASTIGDNFQTFAAKPPTTFPRDENDPFDSISEDTSEDEAATIPRQTQAQIPANPFQKTLETMEHPEREGPVILPTNVTSPGRASLDVDAFKRLLMTGNAGLGISTPTTTQAVVHHGLGDGGSSTDTSSLSRQTIFEPVQEAHPESPRTSHEISEPEDERRGADVSTAGRKKPPPPSSRHGKLIKVELRDDHSSIPLASPTTPGSSSSNQYFSLSPAQRSQTDLNKPLPPAPARASHESDRESIFDKEAAGKTPEPPSPSASLRRKTPPAPPLGRRHSQLVSDSKRTTRSDTSRLSPKVEEEDRSSILSAMEIGRPRSNSGRAPPPPPTRRPANLRGTSNPPLTSPSTMSLPPIPPGRGPSKSVSDRPASVRSMDVYSPPISSTSTPSRRSSMMPPPPPPPHRHGRNSMEDGSRRTSAEHGRRSIDSARRGSETSSIARVESVESPEPADANNGGQDILAEMSKLQREIDALRVQSEKERAT